VASLAVSPDHRLVAFGLHGESDIRIWEVASATERARLKGHREVVSALAFSPDGKLLASGSADTTILIWDLNRPFHLQKPHSAVPTEKELAAHWDMLADPEAARADAAIWALVYAPAQSVPFLQKHLHPVESLPEAQVQKLIADLDSDNFGTRQKALLKLELLHEGAEPALQAALTGKLGVEGHLRVQRLLKKIRQPMANARLVQARRALEVLERIGTQEAKQLLQTLAKGDSQARLTQEAQACLRRLQD
jgi:hypothetical protein